MPRPISYCDCGAVFASRGIEVSGIRNLTLQGNAETCPQCGRPARIADGVFDATSDAITLLQGPEITRALYDRFIDLTKEARMKQMGPDEFVRRADAIHPDFGKAAQKVAKSKIAWGIALTIILAALNSCQVNATVDVNKLFDQLLYHPDQSMHEVHKPEQKKRDGGGNTA
ncbi:MAG: hypothetical protein ACTHKQ_05745 [Mesorhizobium sp.]